MSFPDDSFAGTWREHLTGRYAPEDDPEWSEREAAREARERYEASEPWKCPSYWEGGDGQEG